MNILITGGASGLGASIVEALAADTGNTVYFTYATSATEAHALEAALQNTKAIHCDFTDTDSIETLLKQLPELDIDILVNNAYTGIQTDHFYKTEPYSFQKSFEQNVVPTLQITQAAIKIFRKKKYGKIINIISSYVINKPPAGLSVYVANKAYLLSMSKSWANEYIRFNITSNSISPSFMLTNLTAGTDERILEQMKENHPLSTLLTTGEVADAVLFFARASQQINGANLVINAGSDL